MFHALKDFASPTRRPLGKPVSVRLVSCAYVPRKVGWPRPGLDAAIDEGRMGVGASESWMALLPWERRAQALTRGK